MTDSSPNPSSSAAAPPERPRPRLSPIVTVLAGVVLAAGVLVTGVILAVMPKLEMVAEPQRALAEIVGSSLDLELGLARSAAWERGLNNGLSFTSGPDELEQAIAWYEELLDYQPSPATGLQLAVLKAEAGWFDELRELAEEWSGDEPAFAAVAALIGQAYLGEPLSTQAAFTLDELRLLLGADWFYDRLLIAWLPRFADARLSAIARERSDRLAQRARAELRLNRLWTAAEVAVLAGGLLVGLGLRRRRPGFAMRLADAPLPPPWRVSIGLAVLIRGAALQLGVFVALLFAGGWLGWPEWISDMLLYPVGLIPVLLLTRRCLLAPAGLGFCQAFGLAGPGVAARPIAALCVFGLAIQFGGDWVIGLLGGGLDGSSEWVEWFDEALAWGRFPDAAASAVSASVVAPVVEELFFRGLLYGTLRARLGAAPSMLLSAAIFASLHGYGWSGWLGVWWTGVVLAGMYERTRSLVPGMWVHGLGNLLSCLGVLSLRLA